MRKLNITLLLLLIPSIVFAAAPSRTYNYASHATIDPTQNNTNENSLYSYLQSGVDTYAAGSITDTAVSGSAAINYTKLNLLGAIKNADISVSAGIVGSKLDLTSPGAIGSAAANTGSFTTLITSGNVGINTTDVTQGGLIVKTGNVGIGTSFPGVALDVNGTIRATSYSGIGSRIQIFTSNGTFTAPAGVTKVYLSMIGGGGGGGTCGGVTCTSGAGATGGFVINYPYTVTAGNNYSVTIGSAGNGGTQGGSGATAGTSTTFDTFTVGGGNQGASGASAVGGAVLSGRNGASFAATATGSDGAPSPFGLGGQAISAISGSAGSAGANTGAGGGAFNCSSGGCSGATGGNGGSGIVIVQY